MNKYRVYHILARKTERVIEATSSFDARKQLAAILGCGVSITDIVAVRLRQ